MTRPIPDSPRPAAQASAPASAAAPFRIQVVCDRCREEGLAGAESFADLGDLLDFEPVPRKIARADGWTPEIQRAFVAALAVTGSERQSASVVGRAQYGVTQLRRAEGNESFLAACAKAMEIFQEKERVRRADGLLAAVHGEAARARGRPRPAWSGAETRRLPPPPRKEEEPDTEKAARAWLERILAHVLLKLEQERNARLEGRIAAADLYVRQVTCLEVLIDLAAADLGIDSARLLDECRRGGSHLVEIAETPLSRLLDEARRLHWQRCGEPARPAPPRHLFEERDGYTLEPCDQAWSDRELSLEEQWRRFEEQHKIDAQAHVEWEAGARRDYERRRDSAADS
jgi:hypothetical protein